MFEIYQVADPFTPIHYTKINKLVLGTNAAKGVTVSEEQGSIICENFMMYALSFAYLKATEGDKLIDGSYKENRMRMRKNSSVFNGAYHVFDSETSGKDQAEFFLKVLGNLKDGELIPAVDITNIGDGIKDKDEFVKELKAFCDVIENKFDMKPVIHTDISMDKQYLKGNFDKYPKWITCKKWPVYFYSLDGWILWEYSENGQIDGDEGSIKVDLSVVNWRKGIGDLIYIRRDDTAPK
ncbi:MAG: hypothetical protein K6F00_08630 [Lachnospiraceae bacterium]|nr:hypothetical protein [Lachnospiraceae bacterium]